MRITVVDDGSDLDREMDALEARREEERETAILRAVARALREANWLRDAIRNPWPHRGFDFRLNAPYPIDTESKEDAR